MTSKIQESNQSKAVPSPPPPRQSIQEGGPIDQILLRWEPSARQTKSAHQLHERLKRDLSLLRMPTPTCSEIDPVLILCIAEIDQRPPRDHIQAQAVQKLCYEFENYMSILGPLVPQKIAEYVRSKVAYENYVNGVNDTAADDWGAFTDIRREDRERQSQTGRNSRFPTGLPALDKALGGGLNGLTLLGAEKGTGKTSLTLQAVRASLSEDEETAVLFFSLDMDKSIIYTRLLCQEANIPFANYESGELTNLEQDRLDDAEERLRTEILPRLSVVERNFSTIEISGNNAEPRRQREGITYMTMSQEVNRLIRATQARRLLLVLDLFQKMVLPEGVQEPPDQFRLDQFDELSRFLRRRFGVGNFALLVISEVRKTDQSHGHRRELSRDDLKGDGRMAGDANNVLLAWPTGETRGGQPSDVIPMILRIDKGRDGVTRCDIPLEFHHKTYRFYDESEKPSQVTRDASNTVATAANTAMMIDPLAE